MAEPKYVHLTGDYYFDPHSRHILRKMGGRWVFIRHDRRSGQKPVGRDRRSRMEQLPVELKPISMGLYWDEKHKMVYKKVRDNFVLYSKDRRRKPGSSPTGKERRLAD